MKELLIKTNIWIADRIQIIKVQVTFFGFCVRVSHSGRVDKQIAGMAYLPQFFDSSAEFLITCNEA